MIPEVFGACSLILKVWKLLEVHVNRVLPAARVVLEDPPLDRVTLDGEARLIARCELPVDSPLTVVPLEPENACHYGVAVVAGKS